MSAENVHEQAVRLAVAAAATGQSAPEMPTWDYGWCRESYRHSVKAAISSPRGSVRFSQDGVKAIEELHDLLSKRSQVRDRWDLEELWGLLASAAAIVYLSPEKEEYARNLVGRLLDAQPSLVVFPTSNISWSGAPMKIGNRTLMGQLDSEFGETVATLGGRGQTCKSQVLSYIEGIENRLPRVGFATLVGGQRIKAQSQAERRLELLVDLTMMLVPDKSGRNLWSLRGDTNRPGMRGIILDRSAVEAGLRESGDQLELVASPLIVDAVGSGGGHAWRSEDPIPLGEMLQDRMLRNAVERCLDQENGILRRLHVASRWFADSYWASALDDAVLAAGVALDALLGTKSGLPGRAMRERYALLESDCGMRSKRAKEYEEFYSVRSTVAHGGESKSLNGSLLRQMQDSVSWVGWRLLNAQEIFSIVGERELETLFEGLRWGTFSWPNSEDASA